MSLDNGIGAMRNLNSKTLPENIRKRMAPEIRKEFAVPTQPEADAKFIAKREKELQNQIANFLRQRNITFFQQRMDRKTSGTVGWPDFTFAINGQACACEVKIPGGRISSAQTNVLSALMAEGWLVCVVDNLDLFLSWIDMIRIITTTGADVVIANETGSKCLTGEEVAPA